ncbi:hypothetical protein EDB89DRAFT_2076193 [Lactarius sanguifluus]|nr:hypothetical protein EDB89DRAFT_2076193 [Lactarius sanguifluus]
MTTWNSLVTQTSLRYVHQSKTNSTQESDQPPMTTPNDLAMPTQRGPTICKNHGSTIPTTRWPYELPRVPVAPEASLATVEVKYTRNNTARGTDYACSATAQGTPPSDVSSCTTIVAPRNRAT